MYGERASRTTWHDVSFRFDRQSSPLVPLFPSSQTMKTAVEPERYALLPTINGTHVESHASPWSMEQLSLESQPSGTTKAKLGSVFFARSCSRAPLDVVPSGTSHCGHVDASDA